MIEVRLLKDLAFGKKGEVVSLPQPKADYLIKFGSAEKVKPKETKSKKDTENDKSRNTRKSKGKS